MFSNIQIAIVYIKKKQYLCSRKSDTTSATKNATKNDSTHKALHI